MYKNWATWLALVVLLAAGLYFRLERLADWAPNVDEAMHLRIAEGRTLGEVWQFSLLETHPPLGHFLRWLWQQLNPGGDLVYARLLSVIFGMVAIPVYFCLGREAGGRSGGLVGAAIASLGYLPLAQSELVRNYAPFILFIGLAQWAYLRLLLRGFTRRDLVFYGVASLLAVLTHFGGIILAGGLTLALVWEWRGPEKRRPLIAWLLINAAIFTVFLAIYLVQRPYLEPMMEGRGRGSVRELALLPSAVLELLVFNIGSWAGLIYPAILWAISWGKHPRRRELLLILGLPVIALVTLHLLGLYPIDQYSRRQAWLLAPLVAVLAVTAPRPQAWKRSQLFVLTTMMVGIFVFLAIWQRNDPVDPREFSLSQGTWRELRGYLDRELRPGDIVVADFPVAVYFFEGEHNIYRKRWRDFGTDAVVGMSLGQAEIRTQPGRRYLLNVNEFYELTAAALRNTPQVPGARIVYISWELTNPALKKFREDPAVGTLHVTKGFERPGQATVYFAPRELWEKEVLPPSGRFHNDLRYPMR